MLIQFYWTPTWLFVDSPGQTVQDFRLFVGCAQIIQRTKPSDFSWFEQSHKMTPLFLEFCPGEYLAKNSQNSLEVKTDDKPHTTRAREKDVPTDNR